MLSSAHVTLGRYRGVPVRMHLFAPLGALAFGRFEFVPGFWLGFFTLVIVHELGHAYLVQKRGLRAIEVMLHPFGGYCRHESGSPLDNSIIAWGGVLAQALVLLLPTVLLIQLGLWPNTSFGAQLAHALVEINLVMIAFNLIPIRPFDGHLAWKFFSLYGKSRRRSAPKAWQPPPAAESPEAQARRIAEEALQQAREDLRGRGQ
ncbi:MAG: hypothetical protein AAF645_13375 [Myxococcota bacterium]